ncbi:MAG: sigma-70 family RNA polymerase sigma factor [Clostridia bacterium]|nr:sigma-70 family RNA polymerase sigma factor [Clostridia bacterium]
MKRSELLNMIDKELLDRLYGYCYHRTGNSHEASELCSDIVYALIKAANAEGELDRAESFIWRIAHNVYADYADKRRTATERRFAGDPDEVLGRIADELDEPEEDDREQLSHILRHIAFLSRAYREVMIAFYLKGQTVAHIARAQGVSENAVKQRLFSARSTIRKELNKMEKKTMSVPLGLETINFIMWGTGAPGTGDPSTLIGRQLSKHIVWLCRKGPTSAAEISETLHVPMPYIEEELAIQAAGANGYGLLKECGNGKYTTNFILLDAHEIQEMQQLYIDRIPMVCDTVAAYIEEARESLVSFPFLNRHVDLDLVLWALIHRIGHIFSSAVNARLEKEQFSDITPRQRPYFNYAYRDFDGPVWGGGCDGIQAHEVCGYSWVHLTNIYIGRIKAHFRCGHDIGNDHQLRLAIRAVEGLDIATLTELEQESAAKAISEGYLVREGDTLYTKILTIRSEDSPAWETLGNELYDRFAAQAEEVAGEIAPLIRRILPEHLLPEYRLANSLAALPILDTLVESLIERGLLTPPENGVGAEGCWMFLGE